MENRSNTEEQPESSRRIYTEEDERRILTQFVRALQDNPFYTPTKPVSQRYRIQFYSILTGIAMAAGMFVDHEWMFIGVVIIIKGIDLLVFRLRHGWHWTLTDKYLMLAGAAIAFLSYKDGHFMGYKKLDEYSMIVFFASLGVIYPLLMMLETWLKKFRCRKKEDAAVIDWLDSRFLRLPGAGLTVTPYYCPIFKVWRDGQETYLCDEWYIKTPIPRLYKMDEPVTLRVHPRRDTEVYDKKRVLAYFRQKWKAWLIYDVIALSLWISPQFIMIDLAVFVFLADKHYKKTGEESN